jgi:ferritin-like metal-binding protein YciE
MKLAQYLNEALATEMGLVRQLQAQLAMTPEGSYHELLARHLDETRSHADRVQARLHAVGHGNPLLVGFEVAETVAAQWFALAKAPFDLVRGTGIEEKVLKNAKDSAAAEALEIATYTGIEALARAAGDEETAQLAVDIRGDEERMLAAIMAELPGLAEAVAAAGEPEPVTVRARAAVRRRRAAPTPAEQAPTEPWPGYDDQNVRQISSELSAADAATARAVIEYERAHKNRTSVTSAAKRRVKGT